MSDPSAHRNLGSEVFIEGLVRTFPNGVIALDGITLDVAAGDFLAILGPSGCGKSTLLRLISGLDQPQRGSVRVSIPPVDSPRENASPTDVAYVFQDAHLLPWRTVLQNVALPLELLHWPRARRIGAARLALEQVGLADLLDRQPGELSGGQRMRVSLARAIVTDPKLLLLDEPFAALDEITRQKLDEQLRRLWLVRKLTVIFVTHSTQEAAFLARRAVVMSPRPGRIIGDFVIDLIDDRASAVRGTPEFARETRKLYEALERGEK